MAKHAEPAPPIGWSRAILTGLGISIVAVIVLVYLPNAVLTKLHGKTHGSLVAVATTMFFVALFGLAAALRWLPRMTDCAKSPKERKPRVGSILCPRSMAAAQ